MKKIIKYLIISTKCICREQFSTSRKPKIQTYFTVILLAGFCCFFVFSGFSQNVDTLLLPVSALPDTLAMPDSALSKTISHKTDSLVGSKSAKKEVLENTVIRISDSSTLDLKVRKAYLYNNADVTYGSINMKSAYIEIDFGKNTAFASGAHDSIGILTGTPVFSEKGQEYKAIEMRYNFETKKGLIYRIITQEGEGFLHGNVIKKDANDVMNVKDGWYTTCDLDHPHFGLKFSKAKVIPDKKIVVGPAYFVIEDTPTPAVIPFALIPNKKNRRSGILMPSFDYINGMGFAFQKGGYYWYINDYMDLALQGDIYTRGSWRVNPVFNYKKMYKFNGTLDFGYGRNLKGVAGTPSYYDATDFKIRWRHQQDVKAHPVNRFSADIDIQSSNYSKFNPVSNENYLTNSYSSSLNFSTSFWKFNYSISAGFSQNTNTHDVSLRLPTMNLSMSQIYPFKRKMQQGTPKWYEKINVRYTMNAESNIKSKDSMLFKDDFYSKINYGMKHTIPLGADYSLFKLLNWHIGADYNEYWYGKTIHRENYVDTAYEINNGTIYGKGWAKSDTVNGFSATRDFSFNTSLNTKIYGMFLLTKGPIKAVRHVMTPSVGFNYRPDFGTSFWGNYDTYLDRNGNPIRYSIYAESIYGGPPDGESGKIFFSLDNNLEMKVRNRADTVTGAKKVKLIDRFLVSMNYDIAKDSMRWSRLLLSGNTVLFQRLNLTYAAAFDPYAINTNDSTGKRNIAKTEWEVNHRLLRFDDASFGIGLSYDLNPQTFKKKNSATNPAPPPPPSDLSYDPEYYMDWDVPWNLHVAYHLQYTNILDYYKYEYSNKRIIEQSIDLSGDISLTPKWKFSFSSGYNFTIKEISYTTINIYRDLHCWEMSLRWVPFGNYKQWGFQINVKANMLKDLKWTKKKDFRENW